MKPTILSYNQFQAKGNSHLVARLAWHARYNHRLHISQKRKGVESASSYAAARAFLIAARMAKKQQ